MRPSYFLGLLSLSSVQQALAGSLGRLERSIDHDSNVLSQIQLQHSKRADAAPEGSTFNGKHVPPMTEPTGDNLDETIKSGYWLVEFFSPYCGHCKSFAPTWKTLYEFYYTSNAHPSTGSEASEGSTSFTKSYDFHFATVDCIANGDACAAKEIKSFPMVVLFRDGERVQTSTGAKTLKQMSEFIEEHLERIHPGSRPKAGFKLPKAGDDHAEALLLPQPPPEAPASGSRQKPAGASTRITSLVKQSPNPAGRSVQLTAENFLRHVTSTHDPWFVKFYAPWCHHCQAMSPNWQGMARQMRDRLNVGEVNCEVEKRLCKDVKVRGYPTILFFRGGERIEYDGLRGLGDLISFAEKTVAVDQGVQDVNEAQFTALEKKEPVIFLYFYDHATTSEDFKALERLVMSLIGHAKLVKTNDPALAERFKISTWPRLLVSRDGKPTYYTGLSPRDMRDFRTVLNWMKSVWLPIVSEMTASNAREIMDGKLVVLAILSRGRLDEFNSATRELKNAALEWIDKQTQAFQLERNELREAKQLRIEEAEDRNDQRALRAAKSIRINMDDIERKDVRFAWVDGIFWERWIRTTFGISVQSDNERVVMYDYDNHRYWDNTMTGNPIVPSRTSILETLPRVVSNPPKISPKSTTTALGHVWWVLKGQIFEHPFVSTGILLGALLGAYLFARRHLLRTNQSSHGYLTVGEKSMGVGVGAMDGLLGAGAGNNAQGGKVD